MPTMTSGVYDELVAYTSDDVLANKSGVISYYCKTNNGTLYMDGNNCNSYQNVFNQNLTNGNSRYYYNVYQHKTPGSNDWNWKTLVWSLSIYSADNISGQFVNPFGTGTVTLKGGLGGVSYYPVDIDEGVTLNVGSMNSLIFQNYQFEKSEAVASNNGNTDGLTRSTLSSDSQHYLMHTGLFRNVAGTINLTDEALFKGTIGVTSDYSGVLINGILTGTLNTNSAKTLTFGKGNTTITSADTFQLTTTNGTQTDEGYLFINKIGSDATLDLYCIRLNYGASTSTYARSLIGDVVGQNITLAFHDIKMDARNATNVVTGLDSVYTTKRSIFKYATLLNKYDVDSTSYAYYNFTQDEDWSSDTHNAAGKVTYGYEISRSKEFEDLEHWYYDENRFCVDPTTKANASTGNYDFSTNFLPYVRYSPATNATGATYTYHEVKVNVMESNLTRGCGSYDHPYVISDANQLRDLANVINGTANFPSVCLPSTVADVSDNYHNHWCYSSGLTCDANYSWDGSAYSSTTNGIETWTKAQVREYLAGAYYQIDGAIELPSSMTYVGLGASNTSDGDDTGKYAFRGVIVGKEGASISNKTTSPLIKISNGCVVKNLTINVNTASIVVTQAKNSDAFSYSQSYISYGAVIGEIMGGDNIIDHVKVTFSANAKGRSLNVDNGLSCVGGYVGSVVNGGLIFRNMTADDIAFKNSFVIGKNDNGDLTYAKDTTYKRLYNNPFVGRVINGYAINETGTYTNNVYNNDGTYSGDSGSYTLDNGNKNYRIADVNPQDTNKLSKTTFTPTGETNSMWQLSIPDGQSLFMLSLITQSGAGTAQTADGEYQYGISYAASGHYETEIDENEDEIQVFYDDRYDATTAALYPATHLAKYSDVGCTTSALAAENTPAAWSSVSDYVIARKDTTANAQAVPYIIYQYTTADNLGYYPLRTVTGHGTANTSTSTFSDGWYMKLTTANGTYNLPDCFRGIGSICRYDRSTNISDTAINSAHDYGDTDNKFNMKLYGFNGNGSTINCNINYKIYLTTNDNYVNTVYNDSANNTTTGGVIHIGFGLFNSLTQMSKGGYSSISSTSYNLTDGYYIGNFKLSGNINVSEYGTDGTRATGDNLNTNKARNRYPVGGVIGAVPFSSYMKFYDLDIIGLTFDTTSSTAVGGYVGRTKVAQLVENHHIGVLGNRACGCGAWRFSGGVYGQLGAWSVSFGFKSNATGVL